MLNRVYPIINRYKFIILSVPVVLGGTYIGYRFRSSGDGSIKIDTHKLKKREDGLVEYKVSDKEIILVTEEEINLRLEKIQLEQDKLSLSERISKLEEKIKELKNRMSS